MKFTLKDYQIEAVRDVLDNLRKAHTRWKADGDNYAFSLTAATGAGKTVMAAAVFEALFHGEENFDFEGDAGAAVIWFSDDPSLNEQTRFRLLEASDRLRFSDLVVVQNTFNQATFEHGKIYFLNTQKLSKNSLLVRGFDPGSASAETGAFPDMRPDLHSYTIWDTIQKTIDDPFLTLYMVLDEAHRGMGINSNAAKLDKATIVQQLINGSVTVPGIPIVWGISATVERFNDAMASAKGRIILPSVIVDPAKVQESGLVKDTIILDIPGQVGHFDTVLVRRATDKLRESSAAWAEYGKQQNEPDLVRPLMVLQVPNTPDHDDIGRALDTMFEQWPELAKDSVAHVLGEHTTQTFGRYLVQYISPERVQETTWIRILIAKDAISTGWGPRAEVMISFRPANDRTHITQLLGRMVRTPLARRIPGSDRLNSVDCLLPFFDKKSVDAVADALMNGGADGGDSVLPGRRVLINPKEMKPNLSVPQGVWDRFLALPSQSLPQKGAKPVKRLTALAHELSTDGLLPEAGKKAHAEMHKVLDAAQARYVNEIAAARKCVLRVEGKTLIANMKSKGKSFDDFLEDADYAVIEDAYRRASRILSADVSRTYAEYLAGKKKDTASREDALNEAHADIAALGLVQDVKALLDTEADKTAKTWFERYRIPIKGLPDERQEAYRLIKEMSTEPQDIDLARPKSRMEATFKRDVDGSEGPLPSYERHLLCDEEGVFPADITSDWEIRVLSAEMARPEFQAWYRNPPRPSQDSLGIAYTVGDNEVKIVRPDFIFFVLQSDGTIAADIVDPHGTYLSDAIPKLQGLAKYAETHARVYRRVDSIAEIDGKLRVLDLTDPKVRKAVADAKDAKGLFVSRHASDYVPAPAPK